MDDDIHFQNEERGKKTCLGDRGWVAIGVCGGRQSSKAAAERKRVKEKCFAWLQSKREDGGGVLFFFYAWQRR